MTKTFFHPKCYLYYLGKPLALNDFERLENVLEKVGEPLSLGKLKENKRMSS